MTNGGTFVYVSCARSREILVFALDSSNGDLTLVERVPVNGMIMPMAISPDRRFLYSALRSEPYAVAAFAIDGLTGRVTHLNDAPLPHSMAYVSTDRSGRWLLAASFPGSLLSVSPIGPHGFVQPPSLVMRTEPGTHAIQADPANNFVLASTRDGDVVLTYRFDAATGSLSSSSRQAVRVTGGAGPRHFVFHPNQRLVYLVNEMEASVYVFAYDATSGTLTELQTISAVPPGFSDKPAAADLHISPDGRFLYASERVSSTIAAFSVDLASGLLTNAGSFETEQQPRGFNIDPYGRWLFAAGTNSNSMTSYAIDQTSGALLELKKYPLGENPTWLETVRLP